MVTVRDTVVNTNPTAAGAHDLSTVDGIEKLVIDRASVDQGYEGIAAATVAVEINKQSDNTITLLYSDAAGSGDAATITYIEGTGAAGTNTTAAGIETVNLVSSGSSSTVGTLTFAAAETINIAADEAFTIAALTMGNAVTTALNISGDSLVTSTASTNDGALETITVTGAAGYTQTDALSASVTSVDASGTSGSINVISGANTTDITGGSGNDEIGIAALVYSGSAGVDGGAGEDILSVTESTATIFTTAAKANISNFEILKVGGAGTDTFDFEAITGLTGLIVAAATAPTITNVSATAAADVTVTGVQTTSMTIGVKDATNPGTADTLKLTLDHATADTAVTIDDFASVGLETLQLHSTGAGTNTNSVDLAGANDRLSSIIITGDSKFTLTDEADIGTEVSINGSAATAVLTITMDENTSGQSITGGSAADVITGGLGVDIVVGGAGADTFNASSGLDQYTGGAGADKYVLSTATADGTDTVTVTDFARGTGGDVIHLDEDAVAAGIIDGMSAGAATFSKGGIGNIGANDSSISLADNSVIVVTGQGFASYDALEIELDIENGGTDLADVAVLFFNTTSGVAELYADEVMGATPTDEILIMDFSDITTVGGIDDFVTGNFLIV